MYKMKNNACYSVLMSVYDKEKPEWLQHSMDSMWAQTAPTNDFVLVCDGPLHKELDAVVKEMEAVHPELRVIRLEKNKGQCHALNKGIKECRNELIARMDSDDISLPDRCEKELAVFASNPDIDIVSGTLQEFWMDQMMGKRILPETQENIILYSRKRCPFNHPVVMLKKSSVEKAGGYNEMYHYLGDYYLWIRMLQLGCRGYNIPDTLLHMRTPMNLYKRRGGKKYLMEVLRLHFWIRKSGWSSWMDFLTGAVPHMVVCVLPNHIRGKIYKRLREKDSHIC